MSFVASIFTNRRPFAFAKSVMLAFVVMSALVVSCADPAAAAVQNPDSGSIGLEGTISSPPPTRPATITAPANGQVFTSLPVRFTGLCPQGILVKVFSNNVFIGSTPCIQGSYSLQADLFNGTNEIIVRNFDNLDQAGPDSNRIVVTFDDGKSVNFDTRLSLTSVYAKKGANPGETLSWPIIISGGSSPYAINIDWGDGKPATLKAVDFSGTFTVDHVYDSAGIYRVIIKATDARGQVAYLQTVGLANGQAVAGTSAAGKDNKSQGETVVVTKYSIVPSVAAIGLSIASFWLGRRYELKFLRHRIEASAAQEYES